MSGEVQPARPTWDMVSAAVSRLLFEKHGEWCGLPLPVAGFQLQIEAKNPWTAKVRALEQALANEAAGRPLDAAPEAPEAGDVTLVNEWWSNRLGRYVLLVREGGKTVPLFHRVSKARRLLDLMRISEVWNVDAEVAALQRLRELVRPHLWDAYFLTGAFLETSPRSGLTYCFRRCRPTLVFRVQEDADRSVILCALCLHAIGYYQDTWAGSLVPTDEVISHLLLMRGDEALYWRRANQHPPHVPEAGL